MRRDDDWLPLDAAALRRWPLPAVPEDADKEVRGSTLILAGSREIAGAAVLAANAALRAGAGKVLIATVAPIATAIAITVPEARVVALPETGTGGISMDAVPILEDCVHGIDAVLAGPGMVDEAATSALLEWLLSALGETPVVVDALAMKVLDRIGRFRGHVVLTPHAGEMAGLLKRPKDRVQADSASCAREAAHDWHAVVALKGAVTMIAAPDGQGWRHEGSEPGLAISGSGDVLAGLITGLLARGAPAEQAAAWGVVLHAMSGAALRKRVGPVGYLARELPGEIPALLRDLQP